jgi:uncharacterized protein (DUF4415 family)
VKDIGRLSLADIRRLKAEGSLKSDPSAPPGPDLGDAFWADAQLVHPGRKVSVHLKLDPEVFDFFKQGGRGHLTKMQDVLRTYVAAMKKRA